MAEQLGSIVYTVDVDTANMIKAEGIINNSMRGAVESFGKADQAVRDFQKGQESLGRTINKMGQVVSSTGKVVVTATNEYRALAANASQAFSGVKTQVSGTAQAVNRQLNQALTNTSYQIQDIAVQLAGGQNPFLVMAQQIPQIAVGMGAMGAAIGAAVAILGGLAMAVFDTKTALEKAQEAIERVQASITVGANGIANYTEEMRKLRSMSEELARAKLNEVLLDQAAAFKQLRDVGIDAIQSIGGTFTGRTYTDIAAKLGTTKDNIVALREGLVSMNFNPSAEGAAEFARQVAVLDKAVESTDKKGRELVRTLLDISTKYLEGRRVTEQATEALKNNANIVATQAMPGFRDLAEALAASIVKYQSGERAAYRYGLMVKGASEYEQEALLALYDKEQALKKAKEAQDAVTKSLSDYLDKEAEQSAREEEKRQRSREQLASQVSAVGLTPLQEIEKRYQDELAILQAAREQGIEIIGTYNDREIQLAKEKADAIAQFERSQQLGQKLVSVETENALSSLGNAFGNFAEIAKQGGKESFEAYKDMAIAQALISTFLAANNALATPAPPPIPQMLAASIAGLGLLNVANIRKQQYAGAREFGGPVTNGKSYLVGERGPEIFTPGVSGAITSNSALNGGGGVTINNYAAGVEVEPRFDQGRLVEIAVKQAKREIIRDMSNNGQFARSVKANTNTKFTGSR